MTEPTKAAVVPTEEELEKERLEKRRKEREGFSKTVNELAGKHRELELKFAKEDEDERKKKAEKK